MGFNADASKDSKASSEAKNATHSLRLISNSIHRQNKEHKLDTYLGRI